MLPTALATSTPHIKTSCEWPLRAYQLLKGGTIHLLALHERKSQPVELIVVLTQHRLRQLIALAEQELHFLVDQCCHACAARFAGGSVRRHKSVLTRRQVASVQQKPTVNIDGERPTARGKRIAIVVAQARAACGCPALDEHHAYALAHSPACDHLSGEAGHHLEIVLRAGGHAIRPKGQFF